MTGYVFLVFEDERSVQLLVTKCHKEEDKYYLFISSPTMRDKPVNAFFSSLFLQTSRTGRLDFVAKILICTVEVGFCDGLEWGLMASDSFFPRFGPTSIPLTPLCLTIFHPSSSLGLGKQRYFNYICGLIYIS